MDSLGLKDRYIPSEKEIIVNTEPIDFEKLEALLEEKIKECLDPIIMELGQK